MCSSLIISRNTETRTLSSQFLEKTDSFLGDGGIYGRTLRRCSLHIKFLAGTGRLARGLFCKGGIGEWRAQRPATCFFQDFQFDSWRDTFTNQVGKLVFLKLSTGLRPLPPAPFILLFLESNCDTKATKSSSCKVGVATLKLHVLFLLFVIWESVCSFFEFSCLAWRVIFLFLPVSIFLFVKAWFCSNLLFQRYEKPL